MKNIFARIYSTKYMVKESLRMGEIPPSGTAYKDVFYIALPAVAEMVSIAIIGIINTAMVGGLGSYAISAVGLTGQPRMLFIAIFFALNTGVTAIVSRRKGEGRQSDAQLCLKQAVVINILLAIVMSALAVTFAAPLMEISGAKADTIGPATEYFKIIASGFIFQTLSMTICAAQRGVGNTRVTMVVNIAANVVNVIVSFLLIEGRFGFPRLEVRGAAVATVVGSAVGLVLAIASVLKKNQYLTISSSGGWGPDKAMIKAISKVGGSAIIEQIAMRIGFMIYARVVADLGTDAFASHQIGMQVMNLSFTFADGIGAATTALVGQNLGKNRPDLSIMFGNIGQRLAISVGTVLLLVCLIFRYPFAAIFTDEPQIIELSARIMIILALALPIQTSQIVLAGSLRGSGDTRFVAGTMLLTVTIIRPLFSWVLAYPLGLGLIGAWVSIIADQGVRLLLMFRRFSGGKWISIKI